jgi:phosphoribosyl-dephospho-CoA transferase
MELPPILDDVARETAGLPHAAALARLAADARDAGVAVRVYGSWMWQALTGETHVRDASDLDVLIEVAGPDEAERATALLERAAPALSLAIDGELSIPGVGEVHWREYRFGSGDVLVKSVDALRLLPRETLWG